MTKAMTRSVRYMLCIVIACFVAPPSATRSAHATEGAGTDKFVRTRGTSFIFNGKRLSVSGVNNHYLTYGSKAEVINVLDDAVAMGANVVRTFIQPVIGSIDGSVKTIWNRESKADSSNLGSHGVYMLAWNAGSQGLVFNDGEDGLQRLDFLLTEARRRNLGVVVAFLDFWAYMGGAQQISGWFGSTDKYTFFAEDPRTRQLYKEWVSHVLNRVNAIDGVSYKDDPGVFAWELMNEPDIHPSALLVSWLTEMSRFVKSIDKNHLLASGHSNMINRLADLAVPDIDFGTWHGYPAYEKISVEQFNALIAGFCAKGKEYNKPVVLEEFGLTGADPRQAEAYRMWLNSIRENEQCAGWVVWRLVSRQDGGAYPDDHDRFDVHNDGGPTWTVLKTAAAAAARHDSGR